MTEDITADLQGSPRLLIAFMDERDEFAHVYEAAMGLAKRSGARIILYDRDAASSWGDPCRPGGARLESGHSTVIRCPRPS